jgi:hypothetical protein
MTPDGWREAVGHGAVTFVLLAAFPGLGYPLRWRTRLDPRRVMAYIARADFE